MVGVRLVCIGALEELSRQGRSFELLSGSLEERLSRAIEHIDACWPILPKG